MCLQHLEKHVKNIIENINLQQKSSTISTKSISDDNKKNICLQHLPKHVKNIIGNINLQQK